MNNAYEVLDFYAEKLKHFPAIKDLILNLDQENKELKAKNEILEGAIFELTMLLSMMQGGNE